MNSSPLPPSSKTTHWPSLFQFGLSVLAALGLWGTALLLLALNLGAIFRTGFSAGDPAPLLMFAGLALVGTLLIPSAGYAFVRLAGHPRTPNWARWQKLRKLIWLFPILLITGYFVAEIPALSWIVLPLFHLLAIALPVMWFVSFGSRELIDFSPQKAWGVFGVGLTVGPGLILLLELLGGVFVIFILTLLLGNEPGFFEAIQRLQRILQQSQPDFDAILTIVEPYLFQTKALVTGVFFIAGFVPLVEELIKPIGVLFIANRKLTPAQGFVGGMLSGAGFALFESLFQGFEAGDWFILASGRAGTSLIHILTAGLTGWGIALALGQRRYGRLILHYILAVAIHAAWNGLAAMVLIDTFPSKYAPEFSFSWTNVTSVGLLMLTIFAFIILRAVNKRLQREQPATPRIVPSTAPLPSPQEKTAPTGPSANPQPPPDMPPPA